MTWMDIFLVTVFSLGGLGIGVCWLMCFRIWLEMRRDRIIRAGRAEKQKLLDAEMCRAERETRLEEIRQPRIERAAPEC